MGAESSYSRWTSRPAVTPRPLSSPWPRYTTVSAVLSMDACCCMRYPRPVRPTLYPRFTRPVTGGPPLARMGKRPLGRMGKRPLTHPNHKSPAKGEGAGTIKRIDADETTYSVGRIEHVYEEDRRTYVEQSRERAGRRLSGAKPQGCAGQRQRSSRGPRRAAYRLQGFVERARPRLRGYHRPARLGRQRLFRP